MATQLTSPGGHAEGSDPLRLQATHTGRPVQNEGRVTGWWVFAGILLVIAGTLNIIWGIVAIAESQFFTATGAHYVFSDLKTWGWITLILGVLESLAGFSLFAGSSFGRWFGIFA